MRPWIQGWILLQTTDGLRVTTLTFGSPFSSIALSHWMTLSVCLKWSPVACKREAKLQNRTKMSFSPVPSCWEQGAQSAKHFSQVRRIKTRLGPAGCNVVECLKRRFVQPQVQNCKSSIKKSVATAVWGVFWSLLKASEQESRTFFGSP